MALAPSPFLDMLIDLSPTTQAEIADAEIRAFRNLQRFCKGWKEALFDVVEYPGHS